MRAVTFTEFGGPDKLQVIDIPDAVAGPGEVLVAVEAATINPVDYNALKTGFGPRMPAARDGHWILGWDLAGRVAAVGDGVDASVIGKYVLGFSQWFGTGTGTQAALVALPAGNIAIADESIAPAGLTTVGLNALTSLQGIDLLGVTEGSTLFVSGAAGALGAFAVELAAKRGAIVTGYASESDREAVLGFGATAFVSRENGELEGLGLDLAFDPAGVGAPVLAALKDDGAYVTPAGLPEEFPRGITGKRVGVKPNTEQLEQLAAYAAAGSISLRVAETFDAADAKAAFEKFAEPGLRGRVVLTF